MEDITALVEEKNSLHGKAFVLLVEIEYADGQWFRFARDKSDIVFGGNTYIAARIGNVRRPRSAGGSIATFEIPFGNALRVLQSLFHTHMIEGRSGRLIDVHRDMLNDPEAARIEDFTIVSAGSSDGVITLQCRGVRFNMSRARVPRRTITRRRYPGVVGQMRHRNRS